MVENTQNSDISMIRENLDNILDFSLPGQYSSRWFQPGDEKHWLDIHYSAEKYVTITPELYLQEFGSDMEMLSQRQCYIFAPDGRAIATASAWFGDDHYGSDCGRLHWAAMIPKYQGRGLAKPLLTLVCNRLRELGHRKAYLTTAVERIAAINLYRKFGFVPEIKSSEDYNKWCTLQDKLKEPLDLSKYR